MPWERPFCANPLTRFVVEPVMSAKRRHLSSGAPPASTRPARRNAIALTQGKISDGEESSEASTPPKKSSFPDGYSHWNSADHQTSLSSPSLAPVISL
jgi:hypothetical protein